MYVMYKKSALQQTRLFADGGWDAYFSMLSSTHLQHKCTSVLVHKPGVKTLSV